MRLRTSEATIDAFKQEGHGCSHGYTICVLCQFRDPIHRIMVRRILDRSIATQQTFVYSTPSSRADSESTGKPRPKISSQPINAVRTSYVSPPPENGERWLHHSLLCSKAHNMPFTEFVHELGKTVKREESNLLGCYSFKQYKTQALAMQILLFNVHAVLLSKCHGSGGLPLRLGSGTQAGHDAGVGTANAEAAVAAHPSHGLPSDAKSTRDTPIGAPNLNSTETTDATAARATVTPFTGRLMPVTGTVDTTSRKLRFNDAPALVETPVLQHRESPSGDTSTEMGRHKGIATQFCIGFGCSEADLYFAAGPQAGPQAAIAASGAAAGRGRSAGPSAGYRPRAAVTVLTSLPLCA